MKITCTGPNGETFEGQATLLICKVAGREAQATTHNLYEREAVQKALETWCKIVGADPKNAKIK